MTRVAVIGSRGQLGSEIVAALRAAGAFAVIPLTRDDIEVTDASSVRHAFAAAAPEIVINCAAFVHVDDCEDHPDVAFRVNALGALHVARACAAHDALCAYISTDYVFDGKKGGPYTESDEPRPINVYGTSKLAGEYLVRQVCARWLIIRTAGLFGKTTPRGKSGNFVVQILAKAQRGESIKVVDDIRVSPTYALDAATVIAKLLRQNITGLVHVTNSGACSWFEFARAALDLSAFKSDLKPVSAVEFRTKAKRPPDSSLTSVRIPIVMNGSLRPWQEALKSYLAGKRTTTEKRDSSPPH
jgi:dTDP-4-dehydrorhamnose reductase